MADPKRSPTTERKCLWCVTGSSPLTLEHIVPLWAAEVLQGSGTLHHAYAEHGSEAPTRAWDARRPDFKARVACRECNNGWMSELEVAAKARLAQLVRGRSRNLSRVDCDVLSRWAAKTALMFQAAEAKNALVVTSDAFQSLGSAANPGGLPRTMRVWTGSVDAHGVWSKAIGGTLTAHQVKVPHFTILLTFDQVTFMVMGCRDASVLAHVELRGLAKAWVEISHRRTGLVWPPPYRFPADQFPAMPELLPALARVRQA